MSTEEIFEYMCISMKLIVKMTSDGENRKKLGLL